MGAEEIKVVRGTHDEPLPVQELCVNRLMIVGRFGIVDDRDGIFPMIEGLRAVLVKKIPVEGIAVHFGIPKDDRPRTRRGFRSARRKIAPVPLHIEIDDLDIGVFRPLGNEYDIPLPPDRYRNPNTPRSERHPLRSLPIRASRSGSIRDIRSLPERNCPPGRRAGEFSL